MDFSMSIRRAILRSFPTIGAFASSKECSLPTPTVHIYARGERMPSLKNTVALADDLNVSLDYLAGRSDIPDFIDDESRKLINFVGKGKFVVVRDTEACSPLHVGDGVILKSFDTDKLVSGIYAFKDDDCEFIFRKITKTPDGYSIRDKESSEDYIPRKRNLPAFRVSSIVKSL